MAPAAAAQSGTPVACFTQSPASPTTGQTVTFNSSCSQNVAARVWDLDNDGRYDDGNSTSVTRTWAAPGTYTVKLAVLNSSNQYDLESRSVTVANRLPTASFTIAPVAPLTGQAVTFTATSTDPDGTIASHSWDLDNDGSYDDGTGSVVSKTFATPGPYTIKLRSVDNNGGVATSSQAMSAGNRPPTAVIGQSPASPIAGQSVTFTDNSTDADGTIASRSWDTDGDGTTDYNDGTGASVQKTYATAGTYIVRLRTVDSNGGVGTTTKTVSVAAANRPPVPSFSVSPASPVAGQAVTFTNTSTDPDGSIAAQSWDLDGDSTVDFNDGTAASATRTFSAAATYTIRISVRDDDGATQTLSKQVVVGRNPAPQASFTVTPEAPVAGQAVTLTSTSTDDGALTYAWDINDDGVFGDVATATTGITFPAAGSFVIALRVTDAFGNADVASVTVTVAGAPGGGEPQPDPGTAFDLPGTDTPEQPISPPLRLLNPRPIVRIAGTTTRSGARISLLSVRAPVGTRARLRCYGKSCPMKVSTATVKGKKGKAIGTVSFSKIRKSLRAGTVLRVLVTKDGFIGKYTQFTIRRGKSPKRTDSCVMPGSERPAKCPTVAS